MIDLYKIKKIMKNVYQLKLSQLMKIHDIFHTSFLRFTSIDFLTDQVQSSSSSIIVNEKKKYEVNDILNSRYHYNKLQYKISWIDHSSNDIWYSAKNFQNHSKKILNEYHDRYSNKSKSKLRLVHVINAIIWINETSISTENELIKARQWLQQAKEIINDTLIKMQTEDERRTKKKVSFQKKNLSDWSRSV